MAEMTSGGRTTEPRRLGRTGLGAFADRAGTGAVRGHVIPDAASGGGFAEAVVCGRDLIQNVPPLRGQQGGAVAGNVLGLRNEQRREPRLIGGCGPAGSLQRDVRAGGIAERRAQGRQVDRGLRCDGGAPRVRRLVSVGEGQPLPTANGVGQEDTVRQRRIGRFLFPGIESCADDPVVGLTGEGEDGNVGRDCT